MSTIVSIAYTPADVERRPRDQYARVAVQQAVLVEEQGIAGDVKSRGGKRQLNVMRAEMVEQLRAEGFRAAPGELGEQLVIAGLDPVALTPGTCLQLGGSAVIEVTEPRTPCGRFAHIQDCPVEAGQGRIGAMARVVHGGEIAIGASVRVGYGPPAVEHV
jgi:MOSC domain-containing protein YiiM